MKHWIDQLSDLGFFNSISNDSVEEVKNSILKSVSEGRLSFPDSTNRIFGADAEELNEDGFGDALNEFGRVAHHCGIEVEVKGLYTDYDANPIVRQITVNGKMYGKPPSNPILRILPACLNFAQKYKKWQNVTTNRKNGIWYLRIWQVAEVVQHTHGVVAYRL
jgi:hypothetical protein